MAAFADEQVYELLLGECGKTGDLTFRSVVVLLWSNVYGTLYPNDFYLRYLATRWHALTYLLGELRLAYDQSEDDVRESLSQQFSNTLRLAEYYEKSMLAEKNLSGGELLFAYGQMVKDTPIPFERYAGVNPNSLLYRGSPIPVRPEPLVL